MIGHFQNEGRTVFLSQEKEEEWDPNQNQGRSPRQMAEQAKTAEWLFIFAAVIFGLWAVGAGIYYLFLLFKHLIIR